MGVPAGVNWRGLALSLGVAVGTAGAGYLIYCWWNSAARETDEGFSDSKESEPLAKRVLVLGLDGAGKSRVCEAVSNAVVSPANPKPTSGFNVICVQNNGAKNIDIWEIGGAEKTRRYWSNFLQDTDILVFVVDAADRKRFPDAYDEMHKLVGEPRLLEKPFIVLAHKQDVDNAAKVGEVKEALGLEDVKHHRVQIVETSVTPAALQGISQLKELLHSV